MLKNIELFTDYLPSLARMESRTGWEAWPFSGFGTLTFWGLLAKAVFVAILFMGIAYLMRYLFRPGSKLRGEGWETIEEARTRREAEHQEKGKAAGETNGKDASSDPKKS
ncbi:hypothetical protein DPQ33_01175 [Oceanidesulfovibrio indonesiensis]|jgi:hypothetical protein|uniref:Uncharacterized protein n=2 Tax=Oceanidesulfovibrio indonesiensis TaxID=54767 RepID=A0A7M3MKB7_9BACT|nr:hypothetical protein DPQ33_01175 [Oceanidesulfovibrio indonesiensis]